MRRAWTLPLLLLAGAAWAAEPPARPNIILVSIDSLRADHPGCYGGRRGISPSLDALARSAALFENHVSPSAWTMPSHMSLLTSRYPSFHGLTLHPRRGSLSGWLGSALDRVRDAWLRLRGEPPSPEPGVLGDRLRPGVRTLPEALRAAGYRTAAVVASQNLKAVFGFARGCDLFVENPERTPASEQNARALNWIAERPERPFFLFLHYNDLHHTLNAGEETPPGTLPYDCPGPDQRRYLPPLPEGFSPRLTPGNLNPSGDAALSRAEREWIKGLYAGCVRRVDSDLGELLDALRRQGLYEDTLLAVTADHGEEFWDHGRWGHGRSLRQELIRVPLWVKLPGQRQGRRVRTLTSGVDLMPTLLKAAGGGSARLDAQMQGLPLQPLLEGRSLARTAVYAERDFPRSDRAALTSDGWKLLLQFDPRRRALFDLRRDPKERADLASRAPGKLAELEELLLDCYSAPPEH